VAIWFLYRQSADIDEKAIRREKPEELVKALAEAKVRTQYHLRLNLNDASELIANSDELATQSWMALCFLIGLYVCRPTPLN
jgi:predicted house-cleaning NTP pyrophosphatase (Maf/HAM1 superfamily)